MLPSVFEVALPFAVAFVVSMVFGPGVISALKRRRVGQTISEDGPESHKPKAGTPTMGGIIILAGILGAVLAITYFGRTSLPGELYAHGLDSLFAVLLLVVAYALLGLADDYLTIHPVRGVRGIASKPKAVAQILVAIAFVMWLANFKQDFVPVLTIGQTQVLFGAPYWVFAVVFIAGMANFVNITDGLDGLVSGLTAIAASAFALVVILLARQVSAESPMLIALMMALAGACVAFLWFNANPAKVFMGDTGSLAIGVALPAVAILTHREVLMIVIGSVFILDGFSTILQWAVFKFTRITTGTGRRVFKKSPIHHHFELSGWAEQNIVVRFWILAVMAAVVAYSGASWGLW